MSCTRPSGQSQCAIKIAAFGLSYPIMRRRTDLEEKHDPRGGRTIVNRHSSFREIPERGIDPETAIREEGYYRNRRHADRARLAAVRGLAHRTRRGQRRCA